MTRGFPSPSPFMSTSLEPLSSSSSSNLKRLLPQDHESPSKHARLSSPSSASLPFVLTSAPADLPLNLFANNPSSPTLKKAAGTSSSCSPYSFSRRTSSSSSSSSMQCSSPFTTSPSHFSSMDCQQNEGEMRRIKKARRARPSSSNHHHHPAGPSPSQSRKALLAMLLSPIIAWYLDHLPPEALGASTLSTLMAFFNDGTPFQLSDELWEQLSPDLSSLSENISRMGPANARMVGKYLENLAADLSPPPCHF